MHWIMTHRTIEEELALNGRCFIQTVGVSMEPLLHNRKSTVIIEAKKEPLKRDDVVLYQRPNGEHVLHRIIKVLDDAYIIRGDNCIWKEIVPEGWIIGVMVGFFEDEQNHYIRCGSREYQIYLKRLKWRHFIWQMRSSAGCIRKKFLSK